MEKNNKNKDAKSGKGGIVISDKEKIALITKGEKPKAKKTETKSNKK